MALGPMVVVSTCFSMCLMSRMAGMFFDNTAASSVALWSTGNKPAGKRESTDEKREAIKQVLYATTKGMTQASSIDTGRYGGFRGVSGHRRPPVRKKPAPAPSANAGRTFEALTMHSERGNAAVAR